MTRATDAQRRAIEVVAEAWASIDGKLGEFMGCKADPKLDAKLGRYSGYIAEAGELVTRIQNRGFDVHPIHRRKAQPTEKTA